MIDDYFTSNSINFDSLLLDVMICFNPSYMLPPVIKTTNYVIPARGIDEEYDYIEIPLEDKIVTNLLNGVAAKCNYADIKSYTVAEPTLDDPTLEDMIYNEGTENEYTGQEELAYNFAFAWHGRYVFMNNTDEDTVVSFRYAEVAKNVSNFYEEIYRYLKQVYYYALISDWNSAYQVLNLLSNAKSNVIAKNTHTEKAKRHNGHFKPGLWKI